MLFDNNDNQKLIKQIVKNHIPQKKRIKMYRKVVKDDLYKLRDIYCLLYTSIREHLLKQHIQEVHTSLQYYNQYEIVQNVWEAIKRLQNFFHIIRLE